MSAGFRFALGESPSSRVGAALLAQNAPLWHPAPAMNMTTTPPWMSLLIPPDRLQPLEVQLPDLTVCRAVWTGSRWWSDGREVSPLAWRALNAPELAIAV